MPLPNDMHNTRKATPKGRRRRKKRIVSKGMYVLIAGKKLGLFSLSGILIILGFFLLLVTLIALCFQALVAPLFGALAVASFWCSALVFARAKKIESVRPVTSRTSHLLSPKESLVRASDMPTTPPTELLRAAKSGEETPAEELLRATQISSGEKT